MSNKKTRRDFLRTGSIAAAGFFIVPRHVLGGPGYVAPSDRLNIAGIGAGLDFYVQRGVPLFADLRSKFSTQRKSFFIYTDAGVHVPWIKNKEQRNIISQTTGLYTDAGVGFQLATKKGDAFLFSAGYTYKHVAEKQEGFSWGPWPQPGGQTVLNYNYNYNRIAIKFGLMF